MKIAKTILGAALALLVMACSSQADDSSSSESENTASGPAAIHPGWFKTPEAVSETMTRTWGLTFTEEEEQKYFGGFRASLGGVNVAAHGSLVDKPNELFALASHALSALAAEKLVAKQIAKSAAGEPYLFDGLGFALDDDGCYADDAREWCDGKDEIRIGDLTARGVDPNALSKEDRKRLMHTMQSIAEFFLIAIDERTMMSAAEGEAPRHAPAFLLDEVFLPALASGALTATREALAWQEVVTTILMSGWFFDLPAEK